MLTAIVPPKTSTETRYTVVDLSPGMVPGQTVGTPSVSVSVYSGVDPSPPTFSAILINTTGLIQVTEAGGVAGVIYLVTVSGSTAPQLSYYLAVIPPGI